MPEKMAQWQRVYRDASEYRATMVRDMLIEHDIHAVLVSKKDSAYGLGYLEVQVAPDEVILAIKIIQEEIRFE
jgi:hypothetical protein